MSYIVDKKTGEITIGGFEAGIASSPHMGMGNMQNVNIDTETKEVMCNYTRALESQSGNTSSNLTINALDATHLATSNILLNGQWIQVTSSSITGLSTGFYYIENSNSTPTTVATQFQISLTYNGSVIGGLGLTGTAQYNLVSVMGKPIQSATEKYTDGNNVTQYRYFILDINGMVWVYDTGLVNSQTVGLLLWFLPDYTVPDGNSNILATGLSVYNGWVHQFKGATIWCKLTTLLGVNPTSTGSQGWASFASGNLQTPALSPNPHFALTFNGEMFYTDTNFVGTILAISNSGAPTNANLFSYGSVTYDGSGNFTFTSIEGQLPIVNQTIMFNSSGTQPTGITNGTLYYIYSVDKTNLGSTGVFKFTVGTGVGSGQVTSLSGGSGTLYCNSYNPVTTAGKVTLSWSPTAHLFGSDEVTTSLAQLGTQLVVGGIKPILYVCTEGTVQPTAFIPLPESGTVFLLTVNIVVYAFVGSKGHIYVTNGSSASLAVNVSDYTAGIAGTPSSYFDPVWTFGSAMVLRGRVFFSIQDQTSTKVGNAGGIYSFVPSFFNPVTGGDLGTQLRMENENSYGTFNGLANVLIPIVNQAQVAPQYFSAWTSSVSSPTYGIDATGTGTGTQAIIETDLIPTGEILVKKAFENISYKLAAPLVAGESLTINYRQNGTDAFKTAGTIQTEGSNTVSGYITPLTFSSLSANQGQWLQLQIILNPITSSNVSFIRLKEITIK